MDAMRVSISSHAIRSLHLKKKKTNKQIPKKQYKNMCVVVQIFFFLFFCDVDTISHHQSSFSGRAAAADGVESLVVNEKEK